MSLKRILSVDSDPRSTAWQRGVLIHMGMVVESCQGISKEGGCHVVNGKHCPKLERADGIIFHLDLTQATNQNLLDSYLSHSRERDIPIFVISDQKSEEFQPWDGAQVTWCPRMLTDSLDLLSTQIKFRSRKAGKEGD